MIEIATEDSRIEKFNKLFNRGINAWTEAGRLLSDMVEDDPTVYDKILAKSPHLTRDILEAFERVGRGEVYPYLLADSSPGAKALALLPYGEQERLYQGKVPVAGTRSGSFETKEKRVCDLTAAEAARVFDRRRLRPIAEQMRMMRPNVIRELSHERRPSPARNDGPPPVDGGASLDEDPKSELARQLTVANDALLEARTALAQVERDSRFDSWISEALSPIGRLRFALNDGQIAG